MIIAEWILEWILKYLEVLLSWPVITLILGLLALNWFRAPISSFLKRVRSAEGYGVKLDTAEPAQQLNQVSEVTEPKSQDAFLEWVQANPADAAAEYQRLTNGYWWERAQNLIYGSQLEILEHLELKGDDGVKYINLVPFFNAFRRRGGPAATTEMPDYIGFLHDMNFIEYSEKDSEKIVKITPFGVNFLSYLRVQYPAGYKFKRW